MGVVLLPWTVPVLAVRVVVLEAEEEGCTYTQGKVGSGGVLRGCARSGLVSCGDAGHGLPRQGLYSN